MIHLLQQERPNREDVVNKMLGAISKTTFTFKPSKAAFEDLKSSCNLKIIKDQDLKYKFIDYYTVVEGVC